METLEPLGNKNIGIVIFKENDTTGGGSLFVTENDANDPGSPHKVNQMYASFEESPLEVTVGSVVEFKWKGNSGSADHAEQLRLSTE